jgi:hypothetical protein
MVGACENLIDRGFYYGVSFFTFFLGVLQVSLHTIACVYVKRVSFICGIFPLNFPPFLPEMVKASASLLRLHKHPTQCGPSVLQFVGVPAR